MEDIYIQIAAYRDDDLPATLCNLINKARHPERLHFGILLQLKPDDPPEWSQFPDHPHIIGRRIPATESKGACWARSETQKFYRNEKFLLQIDSHMRAVDNWDEILIDMWKSTEDPMAVLSTYPNAFTKPNNLQDNGLPLLVPREFNNYKILTFRSVLREVQPDKPIPNAFIAAGFVFGPGQIVKDIPYDPSLYFYGEEISLAIRLFTNGYNIYIPNKNVLFHLYKKGGGVEITHWSDNSEWYKLNRRAMVRAHAICGTLGYACANLRATVEDLDGLENYWWGNKRTFREFESFAGIDFQNERIIERGAGRRLASNA